MRQKQAFKFSFFFTCIFAREYLQMKSMLWHETFLYCKCVNDSIYRISLSIDDEFIYKHSFPMAEQRKYSWWVFWYMKFALLENSSNRTAHEIAPHPFMRPISFDFETFYESKCLDNIRFLFMNFSFFFLFCMCVCACVV